MEGALDTVEELHLLGVKAFTYEVKISETIVNCTKYHIRWLILGGCSEL